MTLSKQLRAREVYHLLLVVCLAATAAGRACGTTLMKLGFPEMTRQSTMIVRGSILGGGPTVKRGPLVFTQYRLGVAETLKGTAVRELYVAVPGGTWNGTHQEYAGAPELRQGKEYVLFLWTSPTGVTQVIGLTQGLYEVKSRAGGVKVASRVVDERGAVEQQMTLAELRARVKR